MYITSDLLTEIKSPEALGRCDDDACFRAITKAVRRGSEAGLFDPSVGEMAICICDGCVTLPADVQTIISTNQGNRPMIIRSQWFEYSLNGAGSQDCAPCGYNTIAGFFSTIAEVNGPSKIIAEIESAADNQKEVRVFGWTADGKRIYTPGPDGVLQDGFLVPCVFGYSPPNPEAPDIARIDRVHKSPTNGFVKLIAYRADDDSKRTLLGNYEPWETAPLYQRIRVSAKTYLRIKYRRKDIPVRGIGDWINLDNEEALMFLLKSVKYGSQDQYALSAQAEAEAMRLLSRQQSSKSSPAELNQPTIIYHSRPVGGAPDLFY